MKVSHDGVRLLAEHALKMLVSPAMKGLCRQRLLVAKVLAKERQPSRLHGESRLQVRPPSDYAAGGKYLPGIARQCHWIGGVAAPKPHHARLPGHHPHYRVVGGRDDAAVMQQEHVC